MDAHQYSLEGIQENFVRLRLLEPGVKFPNGLEFPKAENAYG